MKDEKLIKVMAALIGETTPSVGQISCEEKTERLQKWISVKRYIDGMLKEIEESPCDSEEELLLKKIATGALYE